MLEVTDAVISVWPSGRVGMHLAPRGDAHDMKDADPGATFGHVAEQLGRRRIAFICTRESLGAKRLSPALKKIFAGALIANEGFDQRSAEAEIGSGQADAVAFGKLFIANPDLPARLAAKAALNAPVPETFYGSGPKGYTDYPFLRS